MEEEEETKLPQYVPVVASELYLPPPATAAAPTVLTNKEPYDDVARPLYECDGRHSQRHSVTRVLTNAHSPHRHHILTKPSVTRGILTKPSTGGAMVWGRCKAVCFTLILALLLLWAIAYFLLYFVYED